MDTRYLPSVLAIRSAEPEIFEQHLVAYPDLATGRSSCSHPTLMQCLVVDGVEHDAEIQIRMAESLLERGSPIDEPLVAAACIGNTVLTTFLLDHGVTLDGSPEVNHGWTPLEESLYWGFPAVTDLLLERGARIVNLRTAAGLGRTDEVARFFDGEGRLAPNHGGIHSPFGDLESIDECDDLEQRVLDNALAYAAMGAHLEAAALLLDRGADVNSIPFGFHYRGTALHWAAIRGHRAMSDLLLARGADRNIEDLTVNQNPASWARRDGHDALAAHLSPTG